MAEEVATSPTAPPSQDRGLFTLYGLFDKKKEEEPEQTHDQPAANAETQTSEHPPTDPPHAATETRVEEGRHGDEITPHTDTQTQPAHPYPTDSPDAVPAVVEEGEGRHPTLPQDYDDDDAPAVKEDRYDDQIIPPATTHADTQTQFVDPDTTDPPRAAAVAVENDQGHANSDEGQQITREDEKQHTNGSSSSSESSSDEEKDDEKKLQSSDADKEKDEEKKLQSSDADKEKDEEKKLQSSYAEEDDEKKKKDNVDIEEKLPEKDLYAEYGSKEKKDEIVVDKLYGNLPPQPDKKEGGAAEKIEGVREKRSVKDKIKEKLTGVGHHSTDSNEGGEDKKVGLLDRIKDKIPGHHSKE